MSEITLDKKAQRKLDIKFDLNNAVILKNNSY